MDGYRSRIKKTYDFSSGAPETEKYIMIYKEEGEMVQILLEMDEHMLNCIKAVFPRQVNIERMYQVNTANAEEWRNLWAR